MLNLLARYDIALIALAVSPPPDSAAPQRERLVAYSRRDTQMLARQSGLVFTDHGTQPSAQVIDQTRARLLGAIAADRFARLTGPLPASLWHHFASTTALPLPGEPWANAGFAAVAEHVEAADGLRQRLGHYLAATFYYAGEWYWGLDRLYHLEQGLQDLGAQRGALEGMIFAPPPDLVQPTPDAHATPINFFLSLRSP